MAIRSATVSSTMVGRRDRVKWARAVISRPGKGTMLNGSEGTIASDRHLDSDRKA